MLCEGVTLAVPPLEMGLRGFPLHIVSLKFRWFRQVQCNFANEKHTHYQLNLKIKVFEIFSYTFFVICKGLGGREAI